MSATRRRGISEEDDLVRQLLEADNVDAVVEKMEEDHYRHLAPIIKTLHTFDPPPPPRGAAASALPRDLSYISSVHDDLGTPLNDFYVSHARGGGGAGQGPISPVPAAGGGADAESASSRRQTSQRTYSKEYSTKSFGATSSQRRGIPPPSPPRWRGDEVPGRTTPPARTYNTTHTSGLGDEGGAANIPEGLDDPNQSRIARQLQVLQNYRELAEMCSKTSDPAVNLLQNLPTERLARQQAEQIRQQHGRSPSPITVHNTYYFNPSGQTEELSIGRHGRTGSRLHPSRRGSQRFNPPPPPPPPEHRADLRGQRLALQSPASDGGSYGGGATPPSPEPLRPDAAAASSSSYHPHPHLPPPPSPPFPDDAATHGHGANTITATTEEADTSVLEEEDYEGDFLCDDDLDDVDYDDYLREPPEPPRIIEREQHRRQPANSAAAAAASTTAPAENISAKDGGDEDHDEKSNPLMSRRSSVSPKSGSISVIRGHDALVAQANDAARNHRQTPERPATATSAREEDEEADSPGNPQLRTHNPAKSSRPGKSPSRSRHGRASSDGRSDDEGSADSMDATEDTNYFDPTGPAMLTTPRRQPQQSQQQQQQYQHNNNMYARGRGRGGAMIQVPGGFARGAGRGGGVVGRGASRPYGYGAATVAVRAQPPTAAAPVSTSPAPRFVSMPGSPPMLNAYTPGQLALLNRLLERMPANHGRGRGGVAGGANGPRLQAGLLYGSLLPSARPETAMVMDPHLANAGRAASVRPVAPPPMQHVSGSAEIAGPRHASDARQRSVSAARSITTRTHRAHHSQPQDLVWQSQSSGCVVGRNGRSSAKHHRYSSHSSHHHAAERHPHRSRAASSTSSDEVMESRRRRDRRVNGGSATHASSSVPRTAVEKEQAKANAKRFGVVAL